MTDEELVKRLRKRQEFESIDGYKRIEWKDEDALEAADRIEALTATLTNLVEKSNAMLDAFCVLETQRQVEAYDSMCATLAEIEGEKT
jgi:hypothetical protein